MIGTTEFDIIKDQVDGLLKTHENAINRAYVGCGDKALSFTFTVKIFPDNVNTYRPETTISLVPERIKDTIKGRVSGMKQEGLFEKDPKRYPAGD